MDLWRGGGKVERNSSHQSWLDEEDFNGSGNYPIPNSEQQLHQGRKKQEAKPDCSQGLSIETSIQGLGWENPDKMILIPYYFIINEN